MKISRRHLIKMGAAVASARASAAQSLSRDAAEAGLTSFNLDPNRRILFKGGTIISMNPGVGDFVQAALPLRRVPHGFLVAASARILPVNLVDTATAPGRERQTFAIRRPNWVLIRCGIKGESRGN